MSNLQHKYFYKTIKNLLKEYKKDEILFRTNSSLGHPNREIESITNYNTNEVHKKLSLEIIVNFLGIQGGSSQLPKEVWLRFYH